jgi:protein O-mannosyl-transferase
MSDTYSTKSKLFFAILALGILILTAYANTLFSPFNFDDQALLLHMNSSSNYYNFWPVRYRHVIYFSFELNQSLSGLNPLSYHLTNILFHFLSSATILLITFKTFSKSAQWEGKAALSLAITIAILFALHPLHTEAITYLSGRASGIGGFFFLLSLLFFIMGTERGRDLNIFLFYSLALMAFGLALLSKETTLTFPLAAILYDLCFMRNENWRPFKGRLLFIYFPLFVFIGAFFFFNQMISDLALGWLGKVEINYALTQSRILGYALKVFLFPINLTFDYDFPPHWARLRFVPVLIWLFVLFAVIKNFRKISPVVIFALLWFFITLSPTNSFLPRTDLLSERNLYLPSIGPIFLIAYGFYYLFFRKSEGRLSKQGMALLVTLFLIMGSLLITRNSVYRTNILLWEDTYKKSPSDLKVLHNLSHFYLEDKRYQQALAPLLRLSRSNASDFYRAYAHSNLGSIYTQNGNFERAKKEFLKAIELEPTLPLGYLNLGTYYASRGKFRQAREEFLRAKERYTIYQSGWAKAYKWGYPMPIELDLNLARVNLQLKSLDEAEKYTHQYLQGIPESSEGLLLLGKIYQKKEEVKLAEETYRKIQEGGLASAKAHNNLGILYIQQNQYKKALDAFNSSIQFYPQIPDAHYNLGKLILDLKRDPTLARKHLEMALAYNQSSSLKQEISRLLEQTLSP